MRPVVYLFFLSSFFVSAQNSLTSDFDAVISYSSTRTNGLKSDREDNTVVGGGIYGFASYYGAVDGSLIWKFWNYSTIHPKDSAWNNFYSPQVIDDLNNNDISDLLCANVGGYSLDSFVNLEDLSSVINN